MAGRHSEKTDAEKRFWEALSKLPPEVTPEQSREIWARADADYRFGSREELKWLQENSKPPYELLVQEAFRVTGVARDKVVKPRDFSTMMRTKVGSLLPLEERFVLDVQPVSSIPTRQLTFRGNAPVGLGTTVRAVIWGAVVRVPDGAEYYTDDFMTPTPEAPKFCIPRPFETSEEAIELRILTPSGTAGKPYRSRYYDAFMARIEGYDKSLRP